MDFPKVDSEKCIGCEACVAVCPDNAIIMENDTARILEDKCRNCRVCERTCPVGAIS